MNIGKIKEIMKKHEEAFIEKDQKYENYLLLQLSNINERYPEQYKQAWDEF